MADKAKFWAKNSQAWGIPLSEVTETLEAGSYVSLGRKYIYIENPKVASTRIKKMIFEIEKFPIPTRPKIFSRVSRREMYIHQRDAAKMPSILSMAEDADFLECERDFFIFSAVRNPFSRLLSAWINKLMIPEPGYIDLHLSLRRYDVDSSGQATFKAFCRYLLEQGVESLKHCNKHWRLQKYLIFPHVINYSKVEKLSDLHSLVDSWNRHMNGVFTEDEIRARLVTASNSSAIFYDQNYYDAESIEIVSNLYAEDFDCFGFDRKNPEQLRAPFFLSDSERQFAYREEIRRRNEVILDLYVELEANSRSLNQAQL